MGSFKIGYFLIMRFILMPFPSFYKVDKWPMMKSSIIAVVKYYYVSFFYFNECKYTSVLFSFQCGKKKKLPAGPGVFLHVPMIFIYKGKVSNFVCSVSLNNLNGLILTIKATF